MIRRSALRSSPLRLSITLAILALGLVACGEAAQNWPNQEQERSEHFHYFSRSDDSERCPGISTDMERQRSLAFDYFGELQAGETIDYYKFRDFDDLRQNGPCPNGSGNVQCQHGHGIWATELMQQHELIHAYLAPRGRTAGFLNEGLAEALSCGFGQHLPTGIPLADLVAWTGSMSALYDESSLFVAYLLELAGPSAFLALRDQLSPVANLDQVRAAFQAVYGASADDLYAAAQTPGPSAGCIRLWECAGPDWDTNSTGYSYLSACGLPYFKAFNVTVPSLFVGAAAEILPCSSGVESPAAPQPLASMQIVALEPGRYFLGMYGDPLRSPVPLELPAALFPLSSVAGDAARCSALQTMDAALGDLAFFPRTLLQGRAGPILIRWVDTNLAATRNFAQSTNQRLTLSAYCSAGVVVRACEGCDNEASCQVLCDGSNAAVAPSDLPQDLVLELSPDPTRPDSPVFVQLQQGLVPG